MDHDNTIILRVEDKVDKITDRLASIDTTLALQHESLKQHIKRTDALEDKVLPLERHAIMAKGVLKFIGLGIGAVGFVAAVVEICGYFCK